jgi:type VI protein secretion system component VasF
MANDHRETTNYPVLYHLYSRVEFIAEQMRKRHKEGRTPLVEHLTELSAIAGELKSLDSRTGTAQSPQGVFEALHLLDQILTRSGSQSARVRN